MKYFTLELLNIQVNFNDPEFEIFDKLWRKNMMDYWNNFKEYQDRLPARFVKEYCKHAFHDYNIEVINYYNNSTKRNNHYNIELVARLDNNKFMIKYIGVTKFRLDINIKAQENVLLYNEILPIDNDKMSHEMILVDGNTVYIEFKKIIFRKIIL